MSTYAPDTKNGTVEQEIRMVSHKKRCAGACTRDRHCRCANCLPRCPTGPTGARGPTGFATAATGPTGFGATGARGPTGFGATGPTGPCCTGPTGPGAVIDLLGSIEKWSGALVLPATLGAVNTAGATVCTFLADSVFGGLEVQVAPIPSPPTLVAARNVTVAPNYPSTRNGITFDELAVSLRATIDSPIAIPAGAVIDVQIIGNAGQADQYVCLTTSFGTGVAPFNIPSLDDPNGPLVASSPEGEACVIEPGDTYDLRVCIRNVSTVDIPLLTAALAAIQVSTTARVASA